MREKGRGGEERRGMSKEGNRSGWRGEEGKGEKERRGKGRRSRGEERNVGK